MRWLLLLPLASACAASSPAQEIAKARALFDANVRAIQARDRDAYLACYRADDALVRAGPDGVKLGYQELATTTPTTAGDWPEKLVATDIELHWVQPGVVYGAYRYEVTIDGVTTRGLSERVFIKVRDVWRIAVTTAFPTAKP